MRLFLDNPKNKKKVESDKDRLMNIEEYNKKI